MKKLTPLFFLICIFSIFLLSCNSNKDNSNHSASSKSGGTLTIGVSGDMDTFNPLFSRSVLGQEIGHLVLVGLADLNEKGEFEGELAESWVHSPDYTTLTYKLRPNLYWSDSTKISASDVKFTYDLLMNDALASPRQGSCEYIDYVKVIDSLTVEFGFTEAYPDQLFDTAGEIIPEHIFANTPIKEIARHPFGTTPISSGPFLLKKWESQQYLELVANPSYFGHIPNLEKVIFKIIPNMNSMINQYKSGEIDMLLDVPPDQISRVQNIQNSNIFNIQGRLFTYIGYNEKIDKFKNPQVRKALTMAIDRQKIIDGLLYGYGSPCISSFPPFIEWAYNSQITPLPCDTQKARELLANAGWTDSDNNGWLDKNGQTFEFKLVTNSDNKLRQDVAEVVQANLKKIGIRVQIETLEWTTLMQDLSQFHFEAYVGGLSTSLYLDPTPIYHSSATNMFNFISYASPEADRLIENGRTMLDKEKAGKLWRDLQSVIYNDQPYTFLFWQNKIIAVKSYFTNVTPKTLSSLYKLEFWSKK